MDKMCKCCRQIFDAYYVEHFFHGELCEPCWEDEDVEDEDEDEGE